MTNIVFYSYFHRYKQARITINDLVSANDFENAITLLNSYVVEHDNYITARNIAINDTTFTGMDNITLHHAKDHLEVAMGDQLQKEATLDALGE